MAPEFLFRENSPCTLLKVRQIALNSLLSAAALFVTCHVLRTFAFHNLPYSPGEVLSDKYETLRSRGANYNVFFVGTSHVYRGINPETFDAVCMSNGALTRSYNAGVFRLSFSEAERIVDLIIAGRPANSEWLIIMEPSLRHSDFLNWIAERELFSHDPGATETELAFHFNGAADQDSAASTARHIGALLTHVGSGTMHLLNYGRLSRTIFPDSDQFVIRNYNDPSDCGYLALDDELRSNTASPESNQMLPELFSLRLQQGIQQRQQYQLPAMQSGIRRYRQLVDRIEAAGGRIGFVATPRFTPGAPHIGDDIEALLRSPPDFVRDHLIGDYRYSDKEATFFEADHFFDAEHLNARGADLFTTRFSNDCVRRFGKFFQAPSELIQ